MNGPPPPEVAVETPTGAGVDADVVTDAPAADGDAFLVSLDAFAGPVEVLLELVSRRQLEISEVSIAAVVDDFLAFVERMGDVDLDVATKFLLVAATLLQIKTARLLPAAGDVDLDEELLADAERDIFLARLLASRTFKDVATVLTEYLETNSRYVPRAAPLEERFRRVAPDLLRRITPGDLARLAAHALAPREEPVVDVSHVAPIRATVRDAVLFLVETLTQVRESTYREVCRGVPLLTAVVRFLAVLELTKSGDVEADQPRALGDISLRWLGGGSADPLAGLEWDEPGAAAADAEGSEGAGAEEVTA